MSPWRLLLSGEGANLLGGGGDPVTLGNKNYFRTNLRDMKNYTL
jgi:hypothetical protein